ncbi:C-C motif chemokine 3-like [Ochotona curzoniae]|uniref:C-C motif chemokine 3-like n=1 Tax=Ochotona curzoniae TaxID=130825 RepID=UPI001B34A908|nr:C-C motif chemokine 3-like [Ochotona curzoniae]
MKIPMAALAVILCAMALSTQVFTLPLGADTPSSCCFSYVSHPINYKFITDYFETNSQCSKPGVIFLTKKGRQVCADPNEAWVQKYMADLKQKA